MSVPPPAESLREKLHRWSHVNVADTRGPDGPSGRVYAVPFARVWDEILLEVERHRRWKLLHRDEGLGLITVECTTLGFRFVDDLTIWVALDANGLTLVDMRSKSRRGRGDLGVNRRRVERLLARLDAALGPSARLVDRRRRTGSVGARGATAEDGATLT